MAASDSRQFQGGDRVRRKPPLVLGVERLGVQDSLSHWQAAPYGRWTAASMPLDSLFARPAGGSL